jgi:hypothetical protein
MISRGSTPLHRISSLIVANLLLAFGLLCLGNQPAAADFRQVEYGCF